METVIEVNGEKYHLVNKSFVGWLKHINNFNSRYKSFEDWYSEFTFLGKDKIKGIESIFIFIFLVELVSDNDPLNTMVVFILTIVLYFL